MSHGGCRVGMLRGFRVAERLRRLQVWFRIQCSEFSLAGGVFCFFLGRGWAALDSFCLVLVAARVVLVACAFSMFQADASACFCCHIGCGFLLLQLYLFHVGCAKKSARV